MYMWDEGAGIQDWRRYMYSVGVCVHVYVEFYFKNNIFVDYKVII